MTETDVVRRALSLAASQATRPRGEGYRPGRRAPEALEHPSGNLYERHNNVELVTERTAFFALGTSETRCPFCAAEVARKVWEEVLGDWYNRGRSGAVRCDGCGVAVPLRDLVMDDPWGFSNFGVTSWNCGELAESWERQLSEVMGFPIVHVCGKL